MLYKSDLSTYRSLLKKGQSYRNIKLERLPIGIPVKQEKIKDVQNILRKHYGQDWRDQNNLVYYRELLDGIQASPENIQEESDNDEGGSQKKNKTDLRI